MAHSGNDGMMETFKFHFSNTERWIKYAKGFISVKTIYTYGI